ncbi:hypothetical protein M569_11686, partial [Genlisea aurea]
NNNRSFFPLTGLQIGDLQSYLSHLHLYTALDSGKAYILVDNRPWLEDLASRRTHLWQLMVTKSRLSPFANTRGRRGKNKEMMKELSKSRASSSSSSPSRSRFRNFRKWFALIDALTLSKKRAMFPVKELRDSLIANSNLHRTLYGFIVFEFAWEEVRGINYLNELQTDTSLAVETRVMRRWEFDTLTQAVGSISSWFPGTLSEQIELKDHLRDAFGENFCDAHESFVTRETDADGGEPSPVSRSSSSFCICPSSAEEDSGISTATPPPFGPYKRRKLTRSVYSDAQPAFSFEDENSTSSACDTEGTNDPTEYRDVLILFRFNDRDLPFKLRSIIMSDPRLLILLEAGLPSWVVFLQSYPVFCNVYRPWMCPLARVLYVLISVVTVLIGFYDLYKNVPLIKATASKLFGPFFDWIETLEMLSRIKYLGTMLFLHNSQKAVRWFLAAARTVRSVASFVVKPVSRPILELAGVFLPAWSLLAEVAGSLFSIAWIVVESCLAVVGDVLEIMVMPLWYVLAFGWKAGTIAATSIVCPAFWILTQIVYVPFRLVSSLLNAAAWLFESLYAGVRDIWLLCSGFFDFAGGVESSAAVVEMEISIWRSVWNDLFSQVFRALRSILNGLVSFFAACNRHRLSIYNHMKELNRRYFC